MIAHKILIVTAIWQRHDLTDIVLSYYGKLAARSNGKITLLAAGSEGETSKMLCNRNGWNYIEVPNLPVSVKWSTLVESARKIDFDFLVITGSDDLLSLPLLEYYDKVYSRDSLYMLGLEDLYFYMMMSSKSYHFHGYPTLSTIGAGRCISRNILDRINWKPWSDFKIDRGLDSCCSSNLKRNWIPERSVKMAETKGVGIDIKHYKTTITEESRILERSSYSNNILKEVFPTEYELIKNIIIS